MSLFGTDANLQLGGQHVGRIYTASRVKHTDAAMMFQVAIESVEPVQVNQLVQITEWPEGGQMPGRRTP